jgi:hypothetical protein
MLHARTDPILHGAEGLLQRFGDLGVAHPVEVRHLDGDLLRLRQRVQALGYGAPHARLHVEIGEGAGRGFLRGLFQRRVPGVTAVGAQVVDRAGPRYRQHPGQRLAPRPIVAARLLPHLPEDVGQDVFGVFARPNDPQNQRKRDAVIAVVEGLQGLGVSRGDPLD